MASFFEAQRQRMLAKQQQEQTQDDWFAKNAPGVNVGSGFSGDDRTKLRTQVYNEAQGPRAQALFAPRGGPQSVTAQPTQRGPVAPGSQAGGDLTSWWNPSDPQGSMQGLLQTLGLPPGSESMAQLQPYLQAIGGRLENPNAQGITSKVILPGVGAVRVGGYFDGGGTPSWTYVPQGGAGGGGGEAYNPNAPLYAPFTEEFNYGEFHAPTMAEAQDDEGYKFALNQGNDILTNSAAARGTYFSPNTMEGLQKFGQDLASSQYDKVYGRRLGEHEQGFSEAFEKFKQKYGIFENNQTKAFSRLFQTAGIGSSAAANVGTAGQNAATNLGNTGQNAASTAAAYAGSSAEANANAGIAGRNAWGRLAGSAVNEAGQLARRWRDRQPRGGPVAA